MTDNERGADIDNPRGYYEWEAIKQIAKKPELLDDEAVEGRAIKCISMLLPAHAGPASIQGDLHAAPDRRSRRVAAGHDDATWDEGRKSRSGTTRAGTARASRGGAKMGSRMRPISNGSKSIIPSWCATRCRRSRSWSSSSARNVCLTKRQWRRRSIRRSTAENRRIGAPCLLLVIPICRRTEGGSADRLLCARRTTLLRSLVRARNDNRGMRKSRCAVGKSWLFP